MEGLDCSHSDAVMQCRQQSACHWLSEALRLTVQGKCHPLLHDTFTKMCVRLPLVVSKDERQASDAQQSLLQSLGQILGHSDVSTGQGRLVSCLIEVWLLMQKASTALCTPSPRTIQTNGKLTPSDSL